MNSKLNGIINVGLIALAGVLGVLLFKQMANLNTHYRKSLGKDFQVRVKSEDKVHRETYLTTKVTTVRVSKRIFIPSYCKYFPISKPDSKNALVIGGKRFWEKMAEDFPRSKHQNLEILLCPDK